MVGISPPERIRANEAASDETTSSSCGQCASPLFLHRTARVIQSGALRAGPTARE